MGMWLQCCRKSRTLVHLAVWGAKMRREGELIKKHYQRLTVACLAQTLRGSLPDHSPRTPVTTSKCTRPNAGQCECVSVSLGKAAEVSKGEGVGH